MGSRGYIFIERDAVEHGKRSRERGLVWSVMDKISKVHHQLKPTKSPPWKSMSAGTELLREEAAEDSSTAFATPSIGCCTSAGWGRPKLA